MLAILYADAKTSDGMPLAIKCDWFRVLPSTSTQLDTSMPGMNLQ